jgi:hypothetical protein
MNVDPPRSGSCPGGSREAEVARLYDGRMWVHYGQAYVYGQEHPGELLARSFTGQANGICGAAEPGSLCLITGLHTGDVHIQVDVLDSEPELDADWEEAVEVSFRPGIGGASLIDWNGNTVVDLGLDDRDYRVRYCARGMQLGRDLDTLGEGEPVDSYAIYFWPAPPAPDQIIRRTSPTAAYWHAAWK